MKTYERLFGAGPRGALIGIVTLAISYHLENLLAFPLIFSNDAVRYSIFASLTLAGVLTVTWSLMSLPPKDRGRVLVTHGAFRYFRHPLYAGFLLFLNFGFAFLLNNWIYPVWALLMFPLWTLNIKSEEKLMRKEFGEEYEAYCRVTWRFIPSLLK